MDKVRQLRKNEIKALDMVLLARKCHDLYFICLNADSDYSLKCLDACSLSEVYEMLKEERPIIEIYGGREEDDE